MALNEKNFSGGSEESGEQLSLPIQKNAEFYRQRIAELEGHFRSEDPDYYCPPNSKNCDLFAWELAETAKKSNEALRLTIAQMRQKLAELSANGEDTWD